MKRLDTKGFSHHIVLVVFVLVFAVAGVGYLVASHAASSKVKLHSYRCTSKIWSRGSHGNCVELIQIALHNERGVPSPPIDKKYRASTVKAVRKEQAKHHLVVDGIVGPHTWRVLCAN